MAEHSKHYWKIELWAWNVCFRTHDTMMVSIYNSIKNPSSVITMPVLGLNMLVEGLECSNGPGLSHGRFPILRDGFSAI